MAGYKSGDRVKIVYNEGAELKLAAGGKKDKDLFTVPLTYPYMDGLVGRVANVYGADEIAVEVELGSLPTEVLAVHTEGTKRLRSRFAESVSEEAKKKLSAEELNFTPHFVLLLTEKDLVKA